MSRVLVLSCLILAGCYESHTRGVVGPDGGPPPAMSGLYVISTLSLPTGSGGTSPGANLDALDSGFGSPDPAANCEQFAPDFVSPYDGTPGIDNAMSSLVGTFESFVTSGETLDESLAASIRSGEVMIGIELRGSVVTVEQVIPLAALSFDATGRLAPGQRFSRGMRFGEDGSLTTSGSRTHAALGELDLPWPATFDAFFARGQLETVQLRFTRSASGLGQGELGARLNAGDVATYWSAEDPSLLPTIVSVLQSVADLGPGASDPQRCDFLSMGMAFEAVPAVLVEP